MSDFSGIKGKKPTKKQVDFAYKKLARTVKKCAIEKRALARGMEVELEHRDVTRGAVVATAKIAAAHLCERPDYYERLDRYVEHGLHGIETVPTPTSTVYKIPAQVSFYGREPSDGTLLVIHVPRSAHWALLWQPRNIQLVSRLGEASTERMRHLATHGTVNTTLRQGMVFLDQQHAAELGVVLDGLEEGGLSGVKEWRGNMLSLWDVHTIGLVPLPAGDFQFNLHVRTLGRNTAPLRDIPENIIHGDEQGRCIFIDGQRQIDSTLWLITAYIDIEDLQRQVLTKDTVTVRALTGTVTNSVRNIVNISIPSEDRHAISVWLDRVQSDWSIK